MPSISDRLKSLGVKTGAQDLPAPPKRTPAPLDQALGGRAHPTHFGETYLVEASYPHDYRHGQHTLLATAPFQIIAAWSGEPRLESCPPQAIAYLDIETTGLSGGTGTYAFLIGAGRFSGESFQLAQFFLRDPIEEPAQLAALEEFLAPCQAVTTYNGKSFDVPLLATRYLAHGWHSPLKDLAHIDLLHLARRLWRDRLPSRTLGNIEVQILGALRTEEDIPGWMAPQFYFDYLRSGDPHTLRGVFYHNAMDVLSLAALLNHSAALLSDPLGQELDIAVDLFALARLFEELGHTETAIRLYLQGLHSSENGQGETPPEAYRQAIHRLAMIHKKAGEFNAALGLWQEAAHHGDLGAHLELAKYYEHRTQEYEQALTWTHSAINLVHGPSFTAYQRRMILPELEHRRSRLESKLSK